MNSGMNQTATDKNNGAGSSPAKRVSLFNVLSVKSLFIKNETRIEKSSQVYLFHKEVITG
jgi:hypothetical protein